MRRRTRTTAAFAAVTLAAGAGVAALAGPAHAAQTTLPITCDGQQLAVRVNTSHSSANGGWAVAQIVDGGTGHLVPTAFSNSLRDETTNQTLFTFDRAKGGGNANHNQPTVKYGRDRYAATARAVTPMSTAAAPITRQSGRSE